MAKPPTPDWKDDDFGPKVRTHQRYYVEVDGKKTRVPGSTTITRMLPKPYLVAWANRLGLDGIEQRAYVDETAAVGNVAHLLVQAFLEYGEEAVPREMVDLELKDYTENQIERAHYGLVAFQEWAEGKTFETEMIEGRLVSQEHRYGGTVDWYGTVDGVPTLLDLKTSKIVGIEHKVQITSYVKLLRENRYPVKRARIIRIPRNPGQHYIDHPVSNEELALCWRIFLVCKELYELQKEWKSL